MTLAEIETDYPFGSVYYHLPASSIFDDDDPWKSCALYDDTYGDKLSDLYDAALHLRYNIPPSHKIRCVARDFDYACSYYMDNYSESLILASPDTHVHLVLDTSSDS